MAPAATIPPPVKDAIAPATTPLLKLLVHFAKSKKKYSDIRQSLDHRALQKIIHEAPTPLPDESEQLQTVLLNVVNQGLTPPVSGKTVSPEFDATT